MQRWQTRIAPSLGGGFAGTPNEVWGTKDYENDTDPTVFFGLYGLPDFYALWRHKGEKAVLWAGSDIRHLYNGYWLDEKGHVRLDNKAMTKWINQNCTSYCENDVEREKLKNMGIDAIVVPSFLGDIDDYQVNTSKNYKDDVAEYYSSVSGNDFMLYGWNKIMDMAEDNPNVHFHLYGNTEHWGTMGLNNVHVHGRVSQEEMNAEIKDMTGAIRMTEFDGFSEILAKSVLWGQHPISYIEYPFMDKKPEWHDSPNLDGAEYYRSIINKYPWNVKVN